MHKITGIALSLSGACLLGLALALSLVIGLDGTSARPAQAAPQADIWYVDDEGDDGNDCLSDITACRTLGAAAGKAVGGDTILVAAGTYTETASLTLSKDLTIIGAGREETFLDGEHQHRVLANTGDLTLQSLTIRNGAAADMFGGGIYNIATLTLSDTLVISNSSSSTAGGIHNRGALILIGSAVVGNYATGSGGGIYNYSSGAITATGSLIADNEGIEGGGVNNFFGAVLLIDSTVRNNSSNYSAGGLYSIGGTVVLSATTVHDNDTTGGGGGLVINQAVFTLTNSTVSGNLADAYCGVQILDASQTAILNSTIADNHKPGGGGVGGIGSSPAGTLQIKNSIVADNDGYQCQVFGTWVSEGHNLSSDSRCAFTETGDLQETDPLLGALGDYGGATLTHPLLPGSPAIDAGDNDGCPAVDQRGVPRPVDGDNSGVAECDIGSYEARHQIAISDAVVVEGDSGKVYAVITVTLTPTSALPVSVEYATAAGTAEAGVDYDPAGGTLIFEPDQSTVFITVTVHGDLSDESDETFLVNLSDAPAADLVDDQAVVTILDDDGLPALVIGDRSVSEGDSGTVDAVFPVTLSPASAETVTVTYATADGSATAGADYMAVSGTLTFDPGETAQAITVTVNGDLIDEGESESFAVVLAKATNANLVDGQGAGVILDDDLARLSIAFGPSVPEGDAGTTAAVFTVTLSTPTGFTVTVDYETRDGYNGALAGSDYVAISGTLTFDPGEMFQNIIVQVIGDEVQELDEEFSVLLTNPDPIAILGSTTHATILNDDYAVFLPLIIR